MSDKVRGLVFGNGFMGNRIATEFGYAVSGVNVLDVHAIATEINRTGAEIVINAVGKTGRPNIDWCETHKTDTIKGNVTAALNLATACADKGIYFVHIGSGCVYNGNNDGKGFSETDEPNFYGPQFYAKTKILAEKALRELPGLQARIRMPIDDNPHDRNLIDKLRRYPKVIDVPNSMTTVPHFLDALATLIDRRREGIYNMTNPGTISAAEIMRMYAEIVDSSHRFEVMPLSELDAVTLGKRSNCYLNTDKLRGEGIVLPEIHDAVRECLLAYKLAVKE